MSGVPQRLRPVERLITQERLFRYAEASGDHNPLHLDPEFAAGTPYGKPIAHGMLVLALASELMTREFGEAWLRGGRLKARFRAPVFPGDIARAEGWLKSSQTSQASQKSRNGEAVYAVYNVAVANQDGVQAITGEAALSLGG